MAQHHGGSSSAHSGTVSSGARWSGMHSAPRFSSGVGMVMVPYAYPVYAYAAPPPDQSYADSYAAAPVDPGNNGWAGPQYTPAPEPPVHSLMLNMEDMDASPPAEPAHYYIALKDHHVYLAVAYWVEGNTLHYFLPGNTHNQVSLSLLDRDLTERLNRESGTEVRLP